MLGRRLIGAAVTIAPLILLLWLDSRSFGGLNGVVLAPVGALAAMAAAAELVHLIQHSVPGLRKWPVVVAAGAAVLVASAPVAWREYPADCPVGVWGWTVVALVSALAGLFVVEMLAYDRPGQATVRLALSVFAVNYVAVPLVFLLHLRRLADSLDGILIVVSVILVAKSADAGAYFVGRSLGRHQMAPVLSPKKTWEGAVGAVVTACVVALLFFYGLAPGMGAEQFATLSWYAALTYGVLIAGAGMIGDLSESLLKRDLQVKDSAAWLPGLGGVLDVLDSLLFAAPVAYLWWVANP